MERIHHDKAEALRTKTLGDQMEARRTRNKALRERKALRLADKVGRPPPAPPDVPSFDAMADSTPSSLPNSSLA
jgi:outer membrane protein TolC